MTHNNPPLAGFATGSRARYNKPGGLDWDKLRADYREHCSDEEREALDAKPVPQPKAPSIINTPTGTRPRPSTKAKSTGDAPGRTSPEAEKTVRQMYRDRKHVLEIGETVKLHRTTVRRILTEAGLWTGRGPQHAPGHAARQAKLAKEAS